MQYKIQGDTLPVVICQLEKGESMITEKGSMAWMKNMEMKTNAGGGIGGIFGRAFTGESIFQNIYTSKSDDGMIAFASSFPGEIRDFFIRPDHSIILQKTAFLASESSINLSVHFQKKIGSGLFGGEGFIMQKVSGNGTVFAEFDGSIVEYDLKNGETMLVDTGYVAAMDESVKMDIEMIKGVKNVLFGGEGLFNTKLTGPGKVWLQTMPLSKVAQGIIPFIPRTNNS